MTSCAVQFNSVVQRFRRIRERPDTVREVFAKIIRGRQNLQIFEALKHISFQVSKGEAVGIIGRNGCGKSTILKLAAGVYEPSEGSVHTQGTIAPLIELGAGFHHELTGRENILLNGLLLGLTKREIKCREESIIEFAELGDFIDSPVKQYSSGMYMRLAFAVATEADPDILLIDEILSVGDLAFQEKCFDKMRRFRRAGKTILLVSHAMEQVNELCDRALLIRAGELTEDGSPDLVTAHYKEILRIMGQRIPEPVVK
ncbi:MAG: ABC transporter ATP-binding protein [Acidobacteria bacterium]|nr:ABC transporter ATP-binding protein [Acidobacteriota bacterium]